jgi:hypothetical protein
LDERPDSLPQFRKTGTVSLQWLAEPFVVDTEEGEIAIDQSTDGWDGGYWVSWPSDGTKPYAISPAFVAANYEADGPIGEPEAEATSTGPSLVAALAANAGLYLGGGGGAESGPFVSRLEVGVAASGAVTVDYEALSPAGELLHSEHTLVSPGPDGRDLLHIAHSESPVVTEMVSTGPTDDGGFRFVQRTPAGPYAMEVVIGLPEQGRLTWAWWWAETGHQPVEQSKADARRVSG